MGKFDRIYQLHHILAGRRTPVPFGDLKERLGCSRSTAYLLGMAARPTGEWFQVAASGVLQRRRLAIRHHSRSRYELTERCVSPQRLTHCRDN